MAALRRSNRSRAKLSGQRGLDGVSDACHELAGAAGQRDGSAGSRSDAVFFGLRKGMMTTTRRQSRRTASARRRLLNSRRVRLGSAMVVGDGAPRIRRGRRRKAVLWVPCCFRRPRLCLAGVPVCAEHGAVRFRGWRARGEAHTHGTLLAGCCRPWPRVWSGARASSFWVLRAVLPCVGARAAGDPLQGPLCRWLSALLTQCASLCCPFCLIPAGFCGAGWAFRRACSILLPPC
ncbi:hypothetical protein TcG_07542 [Trypanosoma cruzi]|nr:hypothetical protein TcG_07542 [Trypanosoma cruzi]